MCLVLAIISIGLSVENREIKQEVHFCAWLLWHAFQFPPPELCHFFSLGWLPSPPSHSPRSLYEWGETLWVSQGLKPIKHFMNLLLWDIFLQTTGSLIPPPVPITEKYPLANNNTKRDELLLGKEELLPQVPSPPRQAPCGSRSHRLVLRTPPPKRTVAKGHVFSGVVTYCTLIPASYRMISITLSLFPGQENILSQVN